MNKAARNPNFTSLVESRPWHFLFGKSKTSWSTPWSMTGGRTKAWVSRLAPFSFEVSFELRVAGLSGGFNGKLVQRDMILEGPMVIVACITVSAFHSGFAVLGEKTLPVD